MTTEYVIGKRYKWNPYADGTNLWKNGILYKIEIKNGDKFGIFVTRSNEEWSIPLNGTCNVRAYK